MKKTLLAIAIAILIVIFAACSYEPDMLKKSEYQDMADIGIVMTPGDETVTTNTKSVTIEYANNTDKEYIFGEEPRLEIKQNDGWYVIPLKEDAAWNDIGYVLPPGGVEQKPFSLEFFYQKLSPGHYRIVKEFYANGEGMTTAAEFNIE